MADKTIKNWKPPFPLTGNGYFYGRVGSGKSWKAKAAVEYYYEKGAKILDLFGGKRGEGPFWCFKSDELALWKEYEKEVGVMSKYGPKEYPVKLAYPYFKETLPDKLPEKKPSISCFIFTLFFKDIDLHDIGCVLGNISGNAKYCWNYIIKNLDDNANGEDILDLFEDKNALSGHKSTSIYRNFILPLVENQILVGKNEETALIDNVIIDEIKDRETIFVLIDDYIPKEFKLFIMSNFLRRVLSLAMEDKIPKNNVALFREMSLFMKVEDTENVDAQQKQNFRNIISDVARYCRSGLYIFGDTQSPAEVKGLVEGQDDLLCMCEMPSAKDREIVCEQLKRDKRISANQIAYIAVMPRHQMAVIERGKKAILVSRVQPPKTKCWKETDGNFYSVWKKTFNEYINIKNLKEHIENIYKDSKIKIDKIKEEKRIMAEMLKVQKKKPNKNDIPQEEFSEVEEIKIKTQDNRKQEVIDQLEKELNKVNEMQVTA